MTHKIGDKVIHKIGRGIITAIDTTTYSITMYTIELTSSKYIGELIIGCYADFQPDIEKGFMSNK